MEISTSTEIEEKDSEGKLSYYCKRMDEFVRHEVQKSNKPLSQMILNAQDKYLDEEGFLGVLTLQNAIFDIETMFQDKFSNVLRRRYIMFEGSCPYQQNDILYPEDSIPLYDEMYDTSQQSHHDDCSQKLFNLITRCVCSRRYRC